MMYSHFHFHTSPPTGFVLVKKVPGTLHFAARSESHTFEHSWMNMSHVTHSFYFGSRPSARKYGLLQRLHPAGGWGGT